MSESDKGDVFVIDSSSLLAYLRGQPGGDLVQRVFSQCADCGRMVKTTALALLQTYETAGAENEPILDDVIALVEQLPIKVEPLTGGDAALSARNSLTKNGMCAAQSSIVELARSTDAILVTADKTTAELYPNCLLILAGSNGRNRDDKGEAFD